MSKSRPSIDSKFRTRSRLALCALVPLLSVAGVGCSGQDLDESESVGTNQEQLLLSGTKWPSGIVPVCWDAASTTRADFALRSRQVRDLANNSWPTVANVEFTGWGTCGTTNPGAVRVRLNDSTSADAGGIGFSSGGLTMNLGTGRGDFTLGLIPHEFGHVLGFSHEMARSDFDDDSTGSCRQGNVSGDTVNTPADRQSIMASTGYCNSNPNLSLWDIVGAQTAYGHRTNVVRPLITGYRSTIGDHATVSTAAGINSVNASGYSWAYAEGWVFNSQVSGTVPLKLYWHAGNGDNFSTATTAGHNSAVDAGYSLVRTEGFVFTSQQPGTIPLKTYWHAGRADNMLVASSAAEQAALGAGYTLVRTEGYIPASTPYALGWTYWNEARLDNLVTAQNSTLAVDANNAGYAFVGFDGAFFKQQYPGTVALKTYWSAARNDHFATGTSAGQTSAVAAGYSFVRNEGFVYSSSAPGMSSANSYWKDNRLDHMTTIGRGSVAVAANYSLVRSEGFGIPINN